MNTGRNRPEFHRSRKPAPIRSKSAQLWSTSIWSKSSRFGSTSVPEDAGRIHEHHNAHRAPLICDAGGPEEADHGRFGRLGQFLDLANTGEFWAKSGFFFPNVVKISTNGPNSLTETGGRFPQCWIRFSRLAATPTEMIVGIKSSWDHGAQAATREALNSSVTISPELGRFRRCWPIQAKLRPTSVELFTPTGATPTIFARTWPFFRRSRPMQGDAREFCREVVQCRANSANAGEPGKPQPHLPKSGAFDIQHWLSSSPNHQDLPGLARISLQRPKFTRVWVERARMEANSAKVHRSRKMGAYLSRRPPEARARKCGTAGNSAPREIPQPPSPRNSGH